MAQANAYFDLQNPDGNPNYESLKLQLGSLRGVIAMDIDSKAHGVSVVFEDTCISKTQLIRILNTIGYQLSNAHHETFL